MLMFAIYMKRHFDVYSKSKMVHCYKRLY